MTSSIPSKAEPVADKITERAQELEWPLYVSSAKIQLMEITTKFDNGRYGKQFDCAVQVLEDGITPLEKHAEWVNAGDITYTVYVAGILIGKVCERHGKQFIASASSKGSGDLAALKLKIEDRLKTAWAPVETSTLEWVLEQFDVAAPPRKICSFYDSESGKTVVLDPDAEGVASDMAKGPASKLPNTEANL
jgi:hypothetical protein